jgi:hypothetical protein
MLRLTRLCCATRTHAKPSQGYAAQLPAALMSRDRRQQQVTRQWRQPEGCVAGATEYLREAYDVEEEDYVLNGMPNTIARDDTLVLDDTAASTCEERIDEMKTQFNNFTPRGLF